MLPYQRRFADDDDLWSAAAALSLSKPLCREIITEPNAFAILTQFT
jgi:hypothetical protein